MKLNPDCIRYILFSVEENTGFQKFVNFSTILDTNEFDKDEIMYHIEQCNLSDMFTKIKYWMGSYDGYIENLTPKAHEFLANIRNDTNWKKIKEKAFKLGSFSLNVLAQTAATYIASII